MAIINLSGNRYSEKINLLSEELKKINSVLPENLKNKKIDDLKDNLTQPFNFMVVGKVKSGKSTFLNALIGLKENDTELFPSNEKICTAEITKVIYGEDNEYKENGIKIISRKLDRIKNFIFIDTPGTGAIIEEHGKITEDFIHNSNLIIFIFEARNIYHKEEWDLIKKIYSEGKPIIFVLQQKDRATEKELISSREEIVKNCLKIGYENPVIFETSAIWELKNSENSGFDELRDYISKNLTGDEKQKLKIISVIKNSLSEIKNISSAVNTEINALKNEETYYKNIDYYISKGKNSFSEKAKIMTDSVFMYYQSSAVNLKYSFSKIIENQTKIKTETDPLIQKFKDDFSENAKNTVNSNFNLILNQQKTEFTAFTELLKKSEKPLSPEISSEILYMIEKKTDALKLNIETEITKEIKNLLSDIVLEDKNFITKIFLRKKKIMRDTELSIEKTFKNLSEQIETHVEITKDEVYKHILSKFSVNGKSLEELKNIINEKNKILNDISSAEKIIEKIATEL